MWADLLGSTKKVDLVLVVCWCKGRVVYVIVGMTALLLFSV